MEIVYRTIFSYSGGYNFLNQQVCSTFRFLAPKTTYLEYLDQVLSEGGKVENFIPSKKIMEAAIEAELLHVLEACKDFIPKYNFYRRMAKKGKLRVLQWAHDRHPWTDNVCAWAAGRGLLEVLKWARANGFPWNVEVCNQAASSGHLEVLKWLIDNGCDCDDNICAWATTGDHLEILQWLIDNGFSHDIDQIHRQAISYCHHRTAGWLESKYY
ncbi:Ankyrin repeat-containing protein [Brazilian cedratvirus IHUMI]|uniref:Ankyrin repeat-containing protein n=1 Tax=Brazilian cedratvirus IHUMI TaxID=2126980 RepID=A0A2R8FG06_9VIRU|nr:Ankyrin repeat-containing protein [Brazilian cedratvirus IHUMI]